uniref:Selenocysteine lyase n=1 Tax=Cyprinus carpio carpio TaxID=630221 RepID=A0A8C1BE48_CYPCA
MIFIFGNNISYCFPLILGLKARDIIYHSRDTIARMVGGKAADIIFTSGGTELKANNLVFYTAVKYFRNSKPFAGGGTNWEQLNERGSLPHIIISNVEHDSIKLTAKHLLKEGKADVTFDPISKVTAWVEVKDVIAGIHPTTCLVSIVLANNEIGIIMPIKDICQRVREVNKQRAASAPKILLHTDAAQAIGKIRVDAHELGVNYITIVGQKLYGPRIGALFGNDPGTTTPVYPLFFGGGQECNFRLGYDMVYYVMGFHAAELVSLNLAEYEAHFLDIQCYLEQKLLAVFGSDKIHFNSHFPGSDIFPNTCNVSILGRGLQGCKVLSTCRGLLASVGAACLSDSGAICTYKENVCGQYHLPFHILLNCGIPYHVATNALRISVGRSTFCEDVDIIVEDLREQLDSF